MQKGQAQVLILAGIVILIALAGGIFFLDRVTAPKSQNVTTSSPQPSPVSEPLTKFEDDQIKGFSFQYNPEEWFIDIDDDLKDCSEMGCSEPYGKLIALTHTEYKSSPKLLSLRITLSTDLKALEEFSSKKACFIEQEIEYIGNDWYRAKTPFKTDKEEETYNNWGRYFFRKQSMKDFDNIINESDELTKGSCQRQNVVKFTNGALNYTVQPLLPVKYKGKPTFISVKLYNTGMGPENTAIADSIVKSITF